LNNDHKRIGLISDTHGLLRKSAFEALQNADIIIHAGDIDTPEVLQTLKTIAPVYPVRGNMDRNSRQSRLEEYNIVKIGEISIYVLHDLLKLDLDPAAAGFKVVVSGHSHRPEIKYLDDVLYINPGSAGPRRSTLPITIGMLEIDGNNITPEIIELKE
jgi:putative phosphoesterase